MPSPFRFLARSPGAVGNLGPGLDMLGCALTGLFDTVEASFHDGRGVLVLEAGHPELPRDATRHASAIAARAVAERAGQPDAPIAIRLTKGLPIAGGQGGSAASSVAGAVAADALLGAKLDPRSLLECALAGESAVAGRHADNIAPILMGGIVLVRAMDPLDVVALPFPATLRVALVRPAQQLRTADARAVLPAELPRALALHQAAQVAAMVAAFASGDFALLARAVDDRIAEPVRGPMIRGFDAARRAALEARAFGCSISGAGPTVFAFAEGDAHAQRICDAMQAAFTGCGVESSARVASIDTVGTRAEVVA